MKRAGSELLQFLAGLAMLAAGLFIFSQKVMVTSYFFSGGMQVGNIDVRNGLIIIPFIIGIVWMFATGGSFASKVMTSLSVLIIILAVILTTNIRLVQITLYDWVLILVLIFGGAGLLIRILLLGNNTKGDSYEDRNVTRNNRKYKQIEDELEDLKRRK